MHVREMHVCEMHVCETYGSRLSAESRTLQVVKCVDLRIEGRRTVSLPRQPHCYQRRRHFFVQMFGRAPARPLEPRSLGDRRGNATELRCRLQADRPAPQRRSYPRQALEPQRQAATRDQRRTREPETLPRILGLAGVAEPPPAVGTMQAQQESGKLDLAVGEDA
jgi:hypothetical protein